MIALSPPPSPPPHPLVALRARRDGWTPERQQQFLAALAALRSITAAAAVVGLSVRSAYKLRDHPAAAAFRAAWEAVMAEPNVAPGPSRLDRVLGRETVTRSYSGLGRSFGAGLGSSGPCTIERPVAARVLVRLLARAEAKVTKAQNRARP